MCRNCTEGNDWEPDEDDYEDEPDMAERWSNFEDHLNYFDIELPRIARAPFDDLDDEDLESCQYLMEVRDTFREAFLDAIDTDGVQDLRSRWLLRDELRHTARGQLPDDERSIWLIAVQLGLQDGRRDHGDLTEYFQEQIVERAYEMQTRFLETALQYERDGHVGHISEDYS